MESSSPNLDILAQETNARVLCDLQWLPFDSPINSDFAALLAPHLRWLGFLAFPMHAKAKFDKNKV